MAMDMNVVEFTLPLGMVDEDGEIHRSGKMRLATAYDEIVIAENEKNAFNKRYRDLLVLCQVITRLGEYETVTPELLENLFEVDFIYLQMLYQELNGSRERKAEARCPSCGNVDEITMAGLFKDMHYYYARGAEEGEPEKGTIK